MKKMRRGGTMLFACVDARLETRLVNAVQSL
jgi:hypothetical protein